MIVQLGNIRTILYWTQLDVHACMIYSLILVRVKYSAGQLTVRCSCSSPQKTGTVVGNIRLSCMIAICICIYLSFVKHVDDKDKNHSHRLVVPGYNNMLY